MTKISKRNWFRIIWFTGVIIFFVWQWSTFQARDIDPGVSESTSKITVTDNDQSISFIHVDASNKELIFFPGGLVDPEAYMPLARAISERGYNFHIIKMPLRMATRGYENIKQIFDLSSKDYILGGHSQGGKMAAQFVYENPNTIQGLYLLGTSHPRDIDLSFLDIPALKIYAKLDGLASVQEVEDNRSLLPEGASMRLIQGGNHSQFGYMGKLLMDSSPTITREEQHQQTVQFLIDFIENI